MNKEALKKLLEQMPRVDIDALIVGRRTLWEDGKTPNPEDLLGYIAQAQQKADAEWIVEQGLVQLPSGEEVWEFIVSFSFKLAEGPGDWPSPDERRLLEEELLRWLRERG